MAHSPSGSARCYWKWLLHPVAGATRADRRPAFCVSSRAGWGGPTCVADTDECASSPCANGGGCAQSGSSAVSAGSAAVSVGSYRCSCAAGFAGADCEDDVDECASGPCANGGGAAPPPPTHASAPAPPNSCPKVASTHAERGQGKVQ